MPGDLTLQGPKVYAQREGTADAGGGQLCVGAGLLSVQGPVRGRSLGALQQLASVRFHDHRGRDSEWMFADGTRWVLRCESGDLLRFSQDLADQLQRPEMVRASLSPQAQLWSTTRAHRTQLLGAVGCGLLALPLFWLGSQTAWLGYLLVALGMGGLLVSAVTRVGDGRPRWSTRAPVARWRRASWVLAWVLPVALIAGGLSGVAAATERARRDAVAAQRETARAASEAALREAEAARLAAIAVEVDRKLAQVAAAIDEGRLEDAAALHAEAAALAPESEQVKAAHETLAPKLSAHRRRQRLHDARAGISLAREVTADRVLCETAQAVGDAWAKLRQNRPSDDTFATAQKLTQKLEHCRKRVLATFSANAEAARAQARVAFSHQLESDLRRRGLAVAVGLSGQVLDHMTMDVERLDDPTLAAALAELRPQASAQGVKRIAIRADKRKKLVRLRTDRTEDMKEVLSPFGLAEPLALSGR